MEPFATDVTRFVVHVSVTPMSSVETDESTEMPSTGGGALVVKIEQSEGCVCLSVSE